MKKIFFSVLLLAGLQSFGQSTKQISIAPTPRTGLTTKGITPLNESGLIPIQEGNTFTIAPNVSFAPRKHYFLKGVLKSAGAFALSYQATKVINTGKNGTATSTNIAPAVGIGLGAGLPDMIKGLKHNKTYLTYSLYNNKQELVTTKSILLSRKTNGVTIDNANTDGYLKVAVIGSRAIAIPGEVNIDITELAPQEYSGSIVTTMSLDASGDCMYGGDDGGGIKNCDSIYRKELDYCENQQNTEIANCNSNHHHWNFLTRLWCQAGIANEYKDCTADAARGKILCEILNSKKK